MMAIFWGRQSQLKLIHLPILLLSTWSSALVKIWSQMNLSNQTWYNRGNQKLNTQGSGWVGIFQVNLARAIIGMQVLSFSGVVLWLSLGFNPVSAFTGLARKQTFAALPLASQGIAAIEHGVIPNDGRDDAPALQALLAQLPATGMTEIELPIGELDLYRPIIINRDHTILRGQGVGRTILTAHFKRQAAVMVLPSPKAKREILTQELPQMPRSIIGAQLVGAAGVPQKNAMALVQGAQDIHLSDFTLALEPTAKTGLVLDHVVKSSLTSIHLQSSNPQSLILRSTRQVTVSYVRIYP